MVQDTHQKTGSTCEDTSPDVRCEGRHGSRDAHHKSHFRSGHEAIHSCLGAEGSCHRSFGLHFEKVLGLPIDLVPLCSSNRGRLSPVSLSSAGFAAVVKISRYPSSTSFLMDLGPMSCKKQDEHDAGNIADSLVRSIIGGLSRSAGMWWLQKAWEIDALQSPASKEPIHFKTKCSCKLLPLQSFNQSKRDKKQMTMVHDQLYGYSYGSCNALYSYCTV